MGERPGRSLGSVVEAIEAARAKAKALLVVGETSRIGAIGLGAIAAAATLDFALRLPIWLRVALWIAGVTLLIWAILRFVAPALRFKPSLTEVALRLERTAPGRKAGLEGNLASAIELERGSHELPIEAALSAEAVRDAVERSRAIKPGVLLAPRWSMRRFGIFSLVLVSCAAVWLLAPTLAAIGTMRVVLPWAGAEWPKRTIVVDATDAQVHAIGRALALRAVVTKTDRPEGDTRVLARYRVVTGDEAGPTRRLLMTSQRTRVPLESGNNGELFERLIETRGVASGNAPVHIEYWFETDDDRTDIRRVRLEEPPRIVRATATVEAPEYARAIAGVAGFVEGDFELGAGDDERAVVGPILTGSRVSLSVRFNKDVLLPEDVGLPEGVGQPHVEPAQWSLAWVADRSLRVPVAVVDQHGLSGFDESVFSFDVGQDLAPTAAIIEPAQDESVLASAVVEVVGEGQDDVGVSNVGIERRLALVPDGSMGAPAESQDEVVSLTEFVTPADAGYTPRSTASATLELEVLDLEPGDEVWLTALVSDTFALDGEHHEAVQSAVRRLRIISESDLVEQIRSELAGVRSAAMRLDAEQARVSAGLANGEQTSELARQQGDIEARIERQQEIVDSMADRMERNRLEDSVLEGTLSDASALLNSAAGAASEAATGVSEAAANDSTRPTPEQQRRIEAEQERVRDELQRVAELLDRGEDAWLVQRQLERLLADQRALEAQTRETGQATTGRRLDQLTAQERNQLDEIAERQRNLSERLDEAIDELEERAEQMRDVDAMQSQAMRDAADRARRENASQQMNEAAEQAEQNQTNEAAQNQQAAAEAIERMLDELQQSESRRDETLRRVLASLIESLETLIVRQEREISALAEAREGGDFAGLDQAMIRLHQNTLGVLDQIAAGFAELSTLRALVDRAAEAQAAAIVALREEPVKADRADANEQESLRRLREAREEARRQDQAAQEREAERQREELEAAYRNALETQVAIRAETEPLIDKIETRRDRQMARRLGAAEQVLQEQLAAIASDNEAVAGAAMFVYAHERLDQLLERVSTALAEGRADKGVKRDQDSAVRILQSLVEAIEQANEQPEFREQEQGQGEGQGGQQQGNAPAIPPIAEVKLLRMMQEDIMLRTRAADDDGADDAEVTEIGRVQQELAGKANELIEKLSQQQGGQGGGQ